MKSISGEYMFKKVLLVLFLLSLSGGVYSQALEVDSSNTVKVSRKIVNSKTASSYDPLPLGTILMFSGNNWEDNKTIPGWYSCTASNESITSYDIPIPNLEDRFIIGSTIGQIEGKGISQKKGGDSAKRKITLSKENLPEHTHRIDHDHNPFDTIVGQGTFDLTITDKFMPYKKLGVTDNGLDQTNVQDNVTVESKEYTLKDIGTHTHRIDVPNLSGKVSGKTGDGTPLSIDIVPAYYRVIYIIKVSSNE